VNVGENFEIECYSHQKAYLHYPVWLHNNEVTIKGSSVEESFKLKVVNATVMDSGLYFCVGIYPKPLFLQTIRRRRFFYAMTKVKIYSKLNYN